MGTNMEGIRVREGNEDELIEEEDTVSMKKIQGEESNEDKNNYENLQMWGGKRKSRIMTKT